MAPSALDRPPSLEELAPSSGVGEALESLAALFGVPVAVIEPTGRTLMHAGASSGVHERVRATVDGRERDEAKLAEVRAVLPPFDQVDPVVVECYTGCRYLVHAIVVDSSVVGTVAMGPFRPAGGPRELAGTAMKLLDAGESQAAQAAYEALPVVTAEDASRRVKEAARIVSLLLASLHTQRITGQLHLAAIEDAYAQLTDKTRRLTEAVARMQEVDRLKSHFLANISHELRTPLTSVIGYSEMLLEGLAGELTTEQREYIRTIMEKGDQLLQIISGVLDVSRIESGTLKVTTEPVDLLELMQAAVKAVAPMALRRKIRLELKPLPRDIPLVQGDKDKIRQILVNLVSNGIKFTPPEGHVEVSAELGGMEERAGTNPPMDTAARFDVDGVRIHVKDSGIGIAEDKLPRIFEPFFQVDSSSTREYGGTGLGLTLVKSFAEVQGGRVWVESTPGRGSCFTVALPRAGAGSAAGVVEEESGGRAQTARGHSGPAKVAR